MVVIHRPRPASDPFYSSRTSDYSQAYLSILRASRSRSIGSTSSSASAAVLILVAPDVDALCAARLFAKLLREDDVPYRVVPVDGYRTLNAIITDDVQGNQEAVVSLARDREVHPLEDSRDIQYSTCYPYQSPTTPGDSEAPLSSQPPPTPNISPLSPFQLHSLLFINLGSILSLPNYFTSSTSIDEENPGAHPLPTHCTVHVLDSHRPWNLDNLFATSQLLEKQICIWDDGEIQERLGLEREAYETLEFDVESDSEEDESESESESGSDEDDDEEEEDEEEEEEEEDGSPKKGGKKRKRTGVEGSDEEGEEGGKKSRKRKHKRRHRSKPQRISRTTRMKFRNVLGRYYSKGAATGTSVAGMMYMLAAKLGRGDNDALWLAILGLTSQYLSSSLHFDDYDTQSRALASDVVALNPRPSDPRGRAHAAADSSVSSTSADDAQIRVLESELRFTLYRHWSLEHSMYHTSYVAAKLGIWREKGMSRLRGLLAKMGFSLQNCRQHYEHMDLDLRATLVSKMDDIAPEYGLTELTYRSYIRSFGFLASPISAADAVEGIHALLNAAYGVRIDVETPGMTFAASNAKAGAGTGGGNYGAPGSSGSELFGQKKPWRLLDHTKGSDKENNRPGNRDELDDGEKTRRVEQDRDEAWKNCFHAAYAALDSKKASSVAVLSSSLALAKSLHTAVISQGVSLIDKQAIRTLASFRLAIIKDGPDLHLFSHPSTLTRLALWLVDALRDLINESELKKAKGKRARKLQRAGKQQDEDDRIDANAVVKNLPFVVAALDEETDVFVVVGVTGAPDFGDTRRNRFGLSFQEAARKSGARTRHDRFETAAIEVRKEDIGNFVEQLHLEA